METFVFTPVETRGRKRKYFTERASTSAERHRSARGAKAEIRLQNIGVIDFETDPFDNVAETAVHPFTACIYTEHFTPIVIWEEDFATFVDRLLEELANIPEAYTFYAHNGGKFDYMFLVHKMRGRVSFKGRGIMVAKLGIHELRDSFHIIPEKLANYKKDGIDYSKFTKANRAKHRDEIITYMVADCRYLFEIVRAFLDKFGMKISIGQAAMQRLREHYKIGPLGENTDATLRAYFYGGRVECLAGRGAFAGHYKLYDVNSMYPSVMANMRHPISSDYTKRSKGGVGPNTAFVELTCDNYGALVGKTEDGETTSQIKHGLFRTSIHEYHTALELGLIDNITIHSVIDNAEFTTFEKFIIPNYEGRQETKRLLSELVVDSTEWNDVKKDDMLIKYLLNNSWGKLAQNSRRYKESYITDPDAPAPEGFEDQHFAIFKNSQYAIWQRPSPNKRFNNVGTAASITGAARSVLMRAINGAVDPIYCDTDSLICREISGVEIHPTHLGAWDLEAEFSEVLVAGKKLYACRPRRGGKDKVKSKGVSGVTWEDLEAMLLDEIRPFKNKGVTLTKTGRQFYMGRNVRATAPKYENPSYHERVRA